MENLDIILNETDETVESEETSGGLGLGRGLNALFGDEEDSGEIASAAIVATDEIEQKIQNEPEALSGRERFTVGIESLYPSSYQPRRLFKDESLEELASSITQYGVLQPLLVRKNEIEAGTYEIIAGERRWRAAQRAQVHDVPVIVLELSDLDAVRIALIENLQREDLDPIDEALGYKRLLEEYQHTQEQLASVVGKSRPHITNMIRLLNLPDTVQGYVSAGDLMMGHARALITAENPEELAAQVIKKGLSVRQTEKLASDAKKGTLDKATPSQPKAKKVTVEKDADTIALENDMTNALGMKVSIESINGKSGALSIEFKSLDQLDEILHRLAHFPGATQNG